MTALTNTSTATTDATRPASAHAGRPGRTAVRAFALHFGEMLAAMFVGMAVLGGAIEAALSLAGSSLAHAPVALGAAVMAFNMTAPMVWWMSHRGHPARHGAEMAGSMIVPTALVVAAYWLDLLPGSSVMLVQHVIMIPAMAAVMLWRRDHYSH